MRKHIRFIYRYIIKQQDKIKNNIFISNIDILKRYEDNSINIPEKLKIYLST